MQFRIITKQYGFLMNGQHLQGRQGAAVSSHGRDRLCMGLLMYRPSSAGTGRVQMSTEQAECVGRLLAGRILIGLLIDSSQVQTRQGVWCQQCKHHFCSRQEWQCLQSLAG